MAVKLDPLGNADSKVRTGSYFYAGSAGLGNCMDLRCTLRLPCAAIQGTVTSPSHMGRRVFQSDAYQIKPHVVLHSTRSNYLDPKSM